MQIENHYQPNFKKGYITKRAQTLMSQRMSSGKFISVQDYFQKTFKDSDISVKVDSVNDKSRRLDAMIFFNTGKKDPTKDAFFEYIEEGAFESIFRSPEKFIEKVVDLYNKKAKPFIQNGFKNVE